MSPEQVLQNPNPILGFASTSGVKLINPNPEDPHLAKEGAEPDNLADTPLTLRKDVSDQQVNGNNAQGDAGVNLSLDPLMVTNKNLEDSFV